ncbi:hypothetical protein OCU04_004770 [Sclerotinia nivalis]|uniref:Uncharacterized protein n=1 Tax=Sclerotinia nivalis TaxID=352851 RepID=A0A9X0AUH5_9HELO|nr:hypothetical protein OCU04_004770 [Sclerotinia nivalis]
MNTGTLKPNPNPNRCQIHIFKYKCMHKGQESGARCKGTGYAREVHCVPEVVYTDVIKDMVCGECVMRDGTADEGFDDRHKFSFGNENNFESAPKISHKCMHKQIKLLDRSVMRNMHKRKIYVGGRCGKIGEKFVGCAEAGFKRGRVNGGNEGRFRWDVGRVRGAGGAGGAGGGAGGCKTEIEDLGVGVGGRLLDVEMDVEMDVVDGNEVPELSRRLKSLSCS